MNVTPRISTQSNDTCTPVTGSSSSTTTLPENETSASSNTPPTYLGECGNSTAQSPSLTSPPSTKRQRLQGQHKKEQDKIAAVKYRSRKRRETSSLIDQQAQLEQENAELHQQIKSAEEEIVILKSALREVYAPCNHSNHHTGTDTPHHTIVTTQPHHTVTTTLGHTEVTSDGSQAHTRSSEAENNYRLPEVDNDNFDVFWKEFFLLPYNWIISGAVIFKVQ